jgi:hypothetical protein
MADRFGVVPSIPFAEGFTRLKAFLDAEDAHRTSIQA